MRTARKGGLNEPAKASQQHTIPDCQLTPAILKRICTWHPCLSHVAPASGAILHCFTSQEITSERNNSKHSSEITLLVHRKCSTARHKAHRAHLPPWIKKGSSEPSPGLPWQTATISWPFLFSLLATAPDLFKSQFCFPLISELFH